MKKAKKVKPKKVAIVPVNSTEIVPRDLIAQAITQKVDVDTMGKLMDLQDRWEAKQAKKAFDSAMADFQSECPVIKKGKAGGSTKSGEVAYYYAPLESIVSQVKGLIKSHGFSYAIKTTSEKGMLKATCIVKHVMGHSEESSFEVPATEGTSIMSGPQKAAAALTFAKRYAFCNAFGILTGDGDNDARSVAPKKAAKDSTPQELLEISMAKVDGCDEPKILEQWKKNFAKLEGFTKDMKQRFAEKVDARINELKKAN